MNGPLLILWILVLGLFISVVVFAILAMIEWLKQTVVVLPSTSTACQPAFNKLTDISSLQCCIIGGIISPNRYFPQADMVISPTPVAYMTACAGFCTEGVSTSNKSLCIDGQGQAQYTQCLANLAPNNCTGMAEPIAYSGLTYYYGNSAGESACPTTGACTL